MSSFFFVEGMSVQPTIRSEGLDAGCSRLEPDKPDVLKMSNTLSEAKHKAKQRLQNEGVAFS